MKAWVLCGLITPVHSPRKMLNKHLVSNEGTKNIMYLVKLSCFRLYTLNLRFIFLFKYGQSTSAKKSAT